MSVFFYRKNSSSGKPFSVIENSRGFSLLSVLVILQIILILVLGLFLLLKYQKNYLKKQYGYFQARYNAESGIHYYLLNNFRNETLLPVSARIALPWADSVNITVDNFGFFLDVISVSTVNRATFSLKARCGAIPDSIFENTIYNVNNDIPLHFCLDAKVHGPIRCGAKGFKIIPFKGRRFQGEIDEDISITDVHFPEIDTLLIQRKINEIKNTAEATDTNTESYLKKGYSKIIIESEDDLKDGLGEKSFLLINKKINLEDINFPKRTIILAKDTLNFTSITAEDLLILSTSRISFLNCQKISVQVIAPRIKIENSEINYPSLIMTYSDSLESRKVELINSSVSAMILSRSGKNIANEISFNSQVIFNGYVLTTGEIDADGNISGSLVAESYVFFESAKYLNYLSKGTANISGINNNIFLPLFLRQCRGYGFINYENE